MQQNKNESRKFKNLEPTEENNYVKINQNVKDLRKWEVMEISRNPFRPHFLNVDVSAEAEDFIRLNLILNVSFFLCWRMFSSIILPGTSKT